MPGQPNDILNALNKTYTDRQGRVFTVVPTFSANHVTAAQDLTNDPFNHWRHLGHRHGIDGR